MRKNKFKVFSFLLSLFLLLGVNSNLVQATTTKYTIPTGKNAMYLTTSLVAPRYGQTISYMFLPPTAALSFGKNVPKITNSEKAFETLMGNLLKKPYSTIWSAASKLDSKTKAELSKNIIALSKKGPVEIRIIKSNYGTLIAAFPWNGKTCTIKTTNDATTKEKIVTYTYEKK